MTTIDITRIQKQILDQMGRIQSSYMSRAIEGYVKKQVLKRLSFDDCSALIMNTPSNRVLDFMKGGYITHTFKERQEAYMPNQEGINVIQLHNVSEEPIKPLDTLKYSLTSKKNKEYSGQKQHCLEFEEEDREEMKSDIQRTYDFCVLVINAFTSIANDYYDFLHEEKLRAKMFKTRFGAKANFEPIKVPQWIEMYTDCIKFKENHQYIENILN